MDLKDTIRLKLEMLIAEKVYTTEEALQEAVREDYIEYPRYIQLKKELRRGIIDETAIHEVLEDCGFVYQLSGHGLEWLKI